MISCSKCLTSIHHIFSDQIHVLIVRSKKEYFHKKYLYYQAVNLLKLYHLFFFKKKTNKNTFKISIQMIWISTKYRTINNTYYSSFVFVVILVAAVVVVVAQINSNQSM